MSKKIENIGAVVDGVSLEKIASYVHEVIADHNEAKTTSTSEVALDKFLNECKDFIIGYAKKCYDYPEDQAYALREFFINKRIEDEAARHQENMKEADIVVDIVNLVDIATDLMDDFLGKHEEANDRIAEIMMRHVPGFQAELNMCRERMEDKNNSKIGRLWLESHNLPYSLYLFEETLFTPCSREIYYRETTCFAYGRAAGLKRLLLGICDRLLA